jgi:hypothetical protein
VHRPGVGHLLMLAQSRRRHRSTKCWCCSPTPGTRSAITSAG